MLARGRLVISNEKLQEMFGLPEDVEIINIKMSDHGEIEFDIISAKKIDGLTTFNENFNMIRRVSIEKLREKEVEKFVNQLVEQIKKQTFKGSLQ